MNSENTCKPGVFPKAAQGYKRRPPGIGQKPRYKRVLQASSKLSKSSSPMEEKRCCPASCIQNSRVQTPLWLGVAQQAQMPLLLHSDLPRNTVQTLASSSFQSLERHTSIYSSSVGKAALKLLTATVPVERNTAPYLESGARLTYALDNLLCWMYTLQAIASMLFPWAKSPFLPGYSPQG